MRKLIAALLTFVLVIPVLSILQAPTVSGGETNPDPLERSVDLRFTVYPNGRVAVKGAYWDADMTIYPYNFTLYEAFGLAGSEATTNVTVLLPPELASEFPYNATTLALQAEYAEGLLDTGINSTVVLPPEIVSQFPFNATDFALDGRYSDGDLNGSIRCIVTADLTDLIGGYLGLGALGLETPFTVSLNYSKGEYNGSITLHLLPGLPIADADIGITGNLTDVCFDGTVSVIYGTYPFPIGEVNASFLDYMENYTENTFNASLFDMTGGLLKCPYINIERENITIGGVVIGSNVNFEVCIQGKLVLADLLLGYGQGAGMQLPEELSSLIYSVLNETLRKLQDTKLRLVYTPADTKLDFSLTGTMHLRDLVEQLLVLMEEELDKQPLPPTEVMYTLTALSMLNATLYSLEDANIHVGYTHDDGRVKLNCTSLVDIESLEEGLLEILSELPLELPPGMPGIPGNLTQLIDSLSAVRLVNVTASQVSSTYVNGRLSYMEVSTLEGNVNVELDYVKSVVIDYLSDTIRPLPWQLGYLNDTQIDIANVKVNLKMDKASTEVKVEGITVQPPVDTINATAFKLDRFFNLTADMPFPRQGEQLRVTIVGGSNATHKVALYNATGVPEPDLVLVDTENRATIMSWSNVTLTDLRGLQFITVAGAQAGDIITDPETVTPENPLIIDATETIGIAINVTGVSDTVAIVVSNVTEPEGVKPPPGAWKLLGSYVQITVSNETVAVNATIRMHYTDAQVAEAGLDESTLTIYCWDATLGEWVAVEPSHVNTEENYVWATISHFSIFVLMGQSPPFWTQWWFIATVAAVIVVVAAAGVLVKRRRSLS